LQQVLDPQVHTQLAGQLPSNSLRQPIVLIEQQPLERNPIARDRLLQKLLAREWNRHAASRPPHRTQTVKKLARVRS
jgi:hypothetical protein